MPGIYSITNAFGVVGNSPIPGNAGAVVSFLTDSSGVRYRGRIYVPWIDISFQHENGTPTDAGVAALQDLGDAWKEFITAADGVASIDFEQVVYHRATLNSTKVTEVRVRDKWGTQKRRGNYGPPNSPVIT